MNKEIYSPVYGCSTIFDDEDDRNVVDYESIPSACKSLKVKLPKLLHKHIVDVADELFRFSCELDTSNNEERNCKISIIEALKELNHVTEYLSKQTLGDTDETSK